MHTNNRKRERKKTMQETMKIYEKQAKIKIFADIIINEIHLK
jgi:hypothetical protein